MRIAIVIEKFDPQGGGAERSTAQIAGELIERGHTVRILAGTGGGAESPASAELDLTYFSTRRLNAFRLPRFARWARALVVSDAFDTSLSVTTAAPAAVVQPRGGTVRETLARNVAMRPTAAKRAFKRLGIALSPKHQVLLSLERRTLADPMVKRVAAVSDYVARQLREHYAFPMDRVEVIPNAAKMPALSEDQRRATRSRMRAALRLEDGDVAFLFAALNPRLKGLGQLLDAHQALYRRGLPAVLLLAGEVGYSEIRTLDRLGTRDRVRIIGPTSAMPELFCAADVTILPTWYDPSSKVVIESLMMGTPAISTMSNGASDFILVDGRPTRGRVIDRPDNIPAMTQAMFELLDPAERERCGVATAGMADQLSMKRHVDRLEQVLMEAAR